MDSSSTTLSAAGDGCMVYVTVGSLEEARSIAQAAVGERLAACANIIGPITSIYRWQGAVEESQEIVLICKTQRSRADALAALIRRLHSYDTPCIVVYDMAAGLPSYLAWIAEETA
jgi:periplasmic divalent cation tolerance protein